MLYVANATGRKEGRKEGRNYWKIIIIKKRKSHFCSCNNLAFLTPQKKDLLGRQIGRRSASFRKGAKRFENIFYYILPRIVDLLACRFMWLLFVRVFFWKGYLKIMGPSKQIPLPYVPQLLLYWIRQKGWGRWYSATLKWGCWTILLNRRSLTPTMSSMLLMYCDDIDKLTYIRTQTFVLIPSLLEILSCFLIHKLHREMGFIRLRKNTLCNKNESIF
jgi:hypothetical protein